MPLSIGTKLGPYEILAPIGAGGMGEVYKARDTKLDREVAIKVLSAAFASDPERLARFEREAKVLASLNHPNIAQIYGVVESDNASRALVMELVPGENLAERLSHGVIPPEEAFKVARQIAEAFEAAHERGIIHRDLKPANVMITPATATSQGVVKVLDFGLAAVLQPAQAADGNPSISPTLTLGATQTGMIMGTAGYMAPEQAAGKPVDRRADIWAFGVVLFEMLTGKRLFDGESVPHTLADVLRGEIDFGKLPPKTPRTISNLLRRCLDREVRNRLRDIGEARFVLDQVLSNPSASDEPPQAAPNITRRSLIPWIAAAVFALAALGLAFLHFREVKEEPSITKTSILPPEKGSFDSSSLPAVSPDGRHLAFAATVEAKTGLWVRDLDSMVARPLPGTEGAYGPFWSPDNRSIAFFASPAKLKRIDIAGGPAQTLCDLFTQGRGGSWSKDGIIVFAVNNGAIFRVSAGGGSVTPATELDRTTGDTQHRFPWFLPDGRHFLYSIQNNATERSAIYVGDVESKDAVKNRQRILGAASNVVYTPPGYLLFVRERTLMAQRFDADKLETAGDAMPIAEQVDAAAGIGLQYQFSLSHNGVLTYLSGGALAGSRITWFDRQGKALGTVGEPGGYQDIALSPDGTRAAIHNAGAQNDLWLFEFSRGTSTRFTFDPNPDQEAVWSPDGSEIIYVSTPKGPRDLYRKATSGAGEAQLLFASSQTKYPGDWSPDGRFLLYATYTPNAGQDLMVLPLKTDGSAAGSPAPFLATPFNEGHGRFSPDGHWVVYTSDESGLSEVYVRPFPVSSGGGKWQVSTGGGYQPLWRRDGKELLYLSPDSQLMSVEVSTSPLFKAANPKPLFTVAIAAGPAGSNTHRWDIAPDGKRFLMNVVGVNAVSAPMTLVTNWQAMLKK